MNRTCKIRLLILSTIIFAASTPAWAQDSVVSNQKGEPIEMPLWPNGPAEENGLTGAEEMGGCIRNISEPALTIYLPKKATGQAVVVMPGGGYGGVCADSEGKQIADLLLAQGIAAIVLKYRLPNQHHNIPADDARRAIRTTRHHAVAWHINPDKIGVWGFSAGGHLASTVSTVFDAGDARATDPIEQQSSRPDFSILFYPVITMDESIAHPGSRRNLIGPDAEYDMVQRYSSELQITADTPPTFILHAGDDGVVPVENSLRYYKQLVMNNVAARLLIFETGGHGPNVFKGNPSWSPVFETWLAAR